MRTSRFIRTIDFASLSLRDLLEARDQYHVHLANLDNVIGTAVGRYRIRDTDPDFNDPRGQQDPTDSEERTLGNSSVRKWSWPCVLVMVSHWQRKDEFRDRPGQFVPPRLYLPDGRVVPTCVIYAPLDPVAPGPAPELAFPSDLTGGGFPILTDEQGQERIGSIGCLVTDGSYVYALTGAHVVGDEGTTAYTIARGERVEVARSYRKSIRSVPIEKAYPGWPGIRTHINVDAGLFKLSDVEAWTAQVYGIGRLGELIDLNVDTLDLDVVGCPVRGQGGASGPLEGEIQGLFYRYRSVGGMDYVAEMLIGPRYKGDRVNTRPGDSGTVWCWDAKNDPTIIPSRTPPLVDNELRPIALQWGGQVFLNPGSPGNVRFALASCLSTVCRELEVELVRDWELGHSLYWGKVGHYKVAATACRLSSNTNLDTLLNANLETIAVSDQSISSGNLPTGSTTHFVALADVADLVWRTTRGKDKANHFADMDEPGGTDGTGPTLMQLWKTTPSSRTPQAWTQFYDSLQTPPSDQHRGALPFRVKQMYDLMVRAVVLGDTRDYIALAGTMAHYVGDACQPLHVSRFHHGRPGHPEDSNVHGDYETKMLDRFAAELVDKVNTAIGARRVTAHIAGGDAAAALVVDLMDRTIQRLSPEAVVNAWIATKGHNHISDLWNLVGDDTAACIAEGALGLATLWESAWVEGDGDHTIPAADLTHAVNKNSLRSRYNNVTFAPSDWLKNM